MTDRTIIAAGQYDDTRVYLISTDGIKNQIDLYDGQSKSNLTSWTGIEISGACFNQGVFALTTLDSLVYVVEDGKVRDIGLDGYLLNTISILDKENLVGAGNKGRLYQINLINSSIKEDRLSTYGFSKPGRDFIGSAFSEKGHLFFGKKRLLIEVENGLMKDIGGITSGEEFYFSCIAQDHSIWVAGLRGPKAVLANYSDGAGYIYDAPTESHRAPVISMFDNSLLIGCQKIFVGRPDKWTMIHDFGENTLISMVVLPSKPKTLFCIGYTGKIDQISI